MSNKIDKIENKILKEYPERYYKMMTDNYKNIIITDVLNTEPVCLIYGRYHPYAADLILECLRKTMRRGEEKKEEGKVSYPYYDNEGILDELEKWICRYLNIKKLGDTIGPAFKEDIKLAGILATHSKIIELKKEHQMKEGKYYGSTPWRGIDEKPTLKRP
ncbi:hypothetical protein ES703_21532 [subsurface metagenome]